MSKIKKVFDFSGYREYVLIRIKSLPKGGRGEFQKIALALRMHTTQVSQVFNGKKDLTFDQACLLAEYFGLNELETDFFLKLVELSRAGTDHAARVYRRQLEKLKTESEKVTNRILQDRHLKEEERAIFYSSWSYSAIRLLSSIPNFRSVDAISTKLGLSKKQVSRALGFLLKTGLCIEGPTGPEMGPKNTHIEAESPLVTRHHLNWRLKAMSRFENLGANELAFTAPVSVSRADIPKIRAKLLATIEDVAKLVRDSESQELACLNLDWVVI